MKQQLDVMIASLAFASIAAPGCTVMSTPDEEQTAHAEQPLLAATPTFVHPETGYIVGKCTATLVDPRYIVTAAHCFGSSTVPAVTGPIVNPAFVFAVTSTSGTEVARSQIDYAYVVRGLLVANDEDIAFGRLVTPIPATVARPAVMRTTYPTTGSPMSVLGYGCTVRAPGVWGDGIKRIVNGTYGTALSVACIGDSGGPRYTEQTGTGLMQLWGITSGYWDDGTDAVADLVRWGPPMFRGIQAIPNLVEVNTGPNATSNEFGGWANLQGVKAVAGKFNRDNRGDIALVGGQYWNTIPVAFGTGTGTFSVTNHQSVDFASRAQTALHAVAEDFDGDGLTDIALLGSSTVPLAFSQGDGTFRITNQPIVNYPAWQAADGWYPAAGDFDGNGRGEILQLGGPLGSSTLRRLVPSGSDGTFTVVVSAASDDELLETSRRPGARAAVGDFDRDGDDDIAVSAAYWSGPVVSSASGPGAFRTTSYSWPHWEYGGSAKLVAGDFDGDGYDDIAVSSLSDEKVRIAFSRYGGTAFIPALRATELLEAESWQSKFAFALRLDDDASADLVYVGDERNILPVGLFKR